MPTPYELWLADKKKREQAEKQGKVNFKEASQASRPQYTLPQYKGRSEDKKITYQWESDLLKPMRGMGRSYNDKYSNWAKSQGMSQTQAEEYRRSQDFEEDRKQKYKLNDDGSPNNRQNVRAGQGAMLQSEVMDGIFKSMNQRVSKSFQESQKKAAEKEKVEAEKNQEAEKIKKQFNHKSTKQNSFLDDLLKLAPGVLKQAVTKKPSITDALNVGIDYAKEGKTLNPATKEIARGANRTANTASLGLIKELAHKQKDSYYNNQVFNEREGGKKAADIAYDLLGYIAPGEGIYSGLTKLMGKDAVKSLSGKAVRGALAGGALTGGEVGVKTAINPDEQNAKQNLEHILLGTAIGGVADPALALAGQGITKGFESAANRTMKNILPNKQEATKRLSELIKSYHQEQAPLPGKPDLRGTNDLIPNGNDIAKPNFVPKLNTQLKPEVTAPKYGPSLEEALANPKADIPEAPIMNESHNKYQKEFEEAVQNQFEYLENSMGKGVEAGTTSNGLDGNFKEVTGTFSVSRNPKWYQDFYKVNGRKPNKTELHQLAEQHVREGFQDEVGDIPAWQPKEIQEIDKEMERVNEMIRQSPEQEEALNPILSALKEDRASLLNEAGMDPNKQYQYMKVKGKGELPEGVQAMQNEIVPLRQPSGKQVKPITRQELMKSMRKNLGVTLRHGRLGNVDENVSGYFKVDPEVIRTKNYGDIGVISHEIGHHLDKQFKLTNPAFDNELMKLGRNTSGKGYTPDQVRDEGLAEFIRLNLTDPQKAVTEAPNFSQHFETLLPKNVKKGLTKAQVDVDRWIEQGPEMRLRGKIDRTGKDQVNVGERVDKLYSQFIDKFDRLKKVEKSVTGKINSAEQSLYKKARLSAGAPKKAEMILRDFKDILKPIEQYGYKMKDVSDYATAVHARELEALDIETGMTKEEIDKVIAKFNTPEMNQVHQGLMKYNNELLSKLEEGQILSKDAVKAMKEKHPNYVPFYRFFEEDIAGGLGGSKGFANLTNPVKRLKGSTRDIIDPLESMIKNTFAVVSAVEKNKVGLELSRLADIEGAGKFVERLHGAQDVKKEHIVTVFEKGEKVQYQLDKDLYESIQQLDEDVSNKVIQFLSVPTSTLRAGATLTPEFMLRNPIRDQFQSYVVSNYGYKPIIDLPLGAWEVFKGKALNKDGLYKQWAKEGGGYGNYLSQDRNYLRETLNHLNKEGGKFQKGFKTIVNPKDWLKILQSMSEFTEESTKLGEFRRAIKKGATPQEAAFQSRDLMDFGRVGTDMKQWNRAVAFLNANIQGKDKIARAFKQNPVRTTVRALTGVTLPAIGAYMAMDKFANDKQKETYENTPKWMKDTFFILPIPGTDELARIPKPFDLAPVFANPVEQIMDHIKDNDPDSWGEFLKRQAIAVSSIPHMLTGLAPIIENVTNYSFFTGGPIVPRRDQDLLPEDQYGVSTSLTARTVGKLTGTSPYKTDNLIRGYGAGLGKYATSGLDGLLQKLNVGKLPPQEAKKWSELPVVNAFTVDTTGGGQIMTDFYDTLDRIKKEKNSASRNEKAYSRGGDYKVLNTTSRNISDVRKKYRKIQSDFLMSPQEKRVALDDLDRQMNQLAREALIEIGEKTK